LCRSCGGASFAPYEGVTEFGTESRQEQDPMSVKQHAFEDTVGIDTGIANIYGTLIIPDEAWGAVIFAHGSGSSRHNPRHKAVAETLHRVGLATLLVDLLTPAEERVDQFTAQHRFDIELLTNRLIAATDWLETKCSQHDFRIGYFGASTGAAAAFNAAARRPEIAAVVSRGGRPDLARDELCKVEAATLLLVGSLDAPVIEANLAAYEKLTRAYRREVSVIPGATHLFEEKGALEEVALFATQWFVRYLGAAAVNREDQKRISRSNRETLDSLTTAR
jgi:dienelactone hydrolase